MLISLEKIGFKPSVIHCNDWQTGVLPFFLKTRYAYNEFYKNIKTVFTIHNLRFQGHFGKRSLTHHHYPFNDENVNFMKIGILNADKVKAMILAGKAANKKRPESAKASTLYNAFALSGRFN